MEIAISIEETSNDQTGAGSPQANVQALERLARDFEQVLDRLQDTRAFAKGVHQTRLFSVAMKLLKEPGGVDVLYGYAARFDAAGVFTGGVWDQPDDLQPKLARMALLGEGMNPPVECLSELRLLAIAQGAYAHPTMTPTAARAFVEQVLAQNLDLLFPAATEAAREQSGANAQRIRPLFVFLSEQLGTAGILAALVAEAERVLSQRPIMVERVETLLHAAARSLPAGDPSAHEPAVARAQALVAALEGPTHLCQSHVDGGS